MSEPARSRCFVLETTGYEGLVERVRAVPPPVGRQILVRLRYASINFRDLKILKGIYAPSPALPIVPLSDGAGEVVAIGPEATRFKVGDHVSPIYCQGWYAGGMDGWTSDWRELSGNVDGVARDHVCYDEADFVAIPEGFPLDAAAALPCAGVTAWHALVHVGRIKPGDTVLVQGSGGVSLSALQIARMSGARVIATSSDGARLERLKALGASDGINYREQPDWDEAARALTGGRGVDHVVEVGGRGSFARSVAATRDGGMVHIVGNLSGGDFPASDDGGTRGIIATMIGVGSRSMHADLLKALALNDVRPVIDRKFAFSDLPAALAHLEAGRHFGKVLLTY